MIRAAIALTVALGFAGAVTTEAANVGVGFGERLMSLTSARQAGTGGVSLEDNWRRGDLLETGTVLLPPGLRWYGIGYQGGVGSTLRLGIEGFGFSAPSITRTTENPDGTYGRTEGTVDALEWGGRAVGQLTLLEAGDWLVGGLGRLSGLMEQSQGLRRTGGLGLELGGQARYALKPGRALIFWGLAGPLGRSAQRLFAYQVTLGTGLLAGLPIGVLGGPEGYAIGADAQFLGEGLFDSGIGGVYWFGRIDQPGFTFFLRAGARCAPHTAQLVQPRGGLGLLWRQMNGFGLQYDYTIAPIGELGFFHYAGLALRLQ